MYNLRTILELVYFASGPLIAIIAAIGLWQLKISRDNAKTAAKRESLKLSADQCSYYLSHITPLFNLYDAAVEDQKLSMLKEVQIIVSKKNLIRLKFKDPKKFLDEHMLVARQFLDVANPLEGFSTYFTSGVASEKIAFSTIGATFCYSVKSILPALILLGDGENFNNTVKLYLIWNQRFESAKLLQNRSRIEERLRSIENKEIKPFGT